MARRVLLMNDDYVENSRLETYLKRLGFDVMALGTEAGLSDRILSFRPDLICAAGSSKVSALSVGIKLKDIKSFVGAVILGFPRSAPLQPQDLLRMRMDRLIETPFEPEVLLRSLCEVLALDTDAFLEKYRKSQWSEESVESQMIRGAVAVSSNAEAVELTGKSDASARVLPSRLSSADRAARFEKAVAGLDMSASKNTLKRTAARDKWAEVKKDWDLEKIEEQNDLKKNFAEALFDPEKVPAGNQDSRPTLGHASAPALGQASDLPGPESKGRGDDSN